jgi:hypothetical protein
MTYDKYKALGLLEQMLEGEINENIIVAIQDQMYGLSLGLVAYFQQLHIWSDIPEHSNQDTREYFAALHNIHDKLRQAGIFSSSVLTD